MAAAINIVGQLYPNLFAVDIADLHTYVNNQKLLKTNCYSSYFDLISGKRNKPVVFQNFGLKLAKSVTETNGLRDVFQKIFNIKSSLDDFFNNLMGQLDSAEWETGTVRAEFRIRLSDFGSIVPLLDELFTIENIKQWTLVFNTVSISRLSKFYVYTLKQMLMDNFLEILRNIERGNISNHEIMERITSISLLESLLTVTLFSGLTYSFASELVWNKSNTERQSLELMKNIKSHNRLVFGPQYFNDNSFKVSVSDEILKFIFKKINRSAVFNFPPVELIIKFNASGTDQEKADILWKIYFSELNKNAFLDNGVPRWKLAAINRQVITDFNANRLQLRGALRAVFNFDKLNKFSAWKNRYYLKLAAEWMKGRGGPTFEIMDALLLKSMKNLGIEHVHYVGNENYNGNSSRHLIVDQSNPANNENSLSDTYTLSRRDTSLLARSKNSLPIQWLDYDIMLLIDGVNRHQSYGTNMFSIIFSDSSLKFIVRREAAKMKTKWKQMVDNGIVRCSENKWYMPGVNTISVRNSSAPIQINQVLTAMTLEAQVQLNRQDDSTPSSSSSSLSSSSSSSSTETLDTADSSIDYAAANNEYDNFPTGKANKL